MSPIERSIAAALVLLWLSPAVAEEAAHMNERPAHASSRDVKIPTALVNLIETQYRTFLSKNEVSGKALIRRKLLIVSPEFTQKEPVALQEDARILTPLGGGIVDLADLVTPLRGAFNMKLKVLREDKTEPTPLRLFYISHAKTREIDGEEYGAGCGKFMEITSYFNKTASRLGFSLYSADQRYLSVVGGTFVAVQFEKEALSVATLTLTDSRYPHLLCD
jgi:hypothetical protein